MFYFQVVSFNNLEKHVQKGYMRVRKHPSESGLFLWYDEQWYASNWAYLHNYIRSLILDY